MSKRGIIGPAVVILVGLFVVAGLIALGISIGKKSSVPTSSNSVVTAEVSPVPSPTLDKTANWKTYSVANQFELKYPIDQYSVVSGQTNLDYAYPGQLIVQPNDSFIQTAGSNIYRVTITPIVNKNHLTLSNVDTLLGVDNSNNQFPAVQITVGGIKAVSYNNVPGQVDRTEIYVIRQNQSYPDGIIYNFTLRTLNGAKASITNETTIQNILSTFKFTQ